MEKKSIDEEFDEDQDEVIKTFAEFASANYAEHIFRIDSILTLAITLLALLFIFAKRSEEAGIALLLAYPFFKLYLSFRHHRDKEELYLRLKELNEEMEMLARKKEQEETEV